MPERLPVVLKGVNCCCVPERVPVFLNKLLNRILRSQRVLENVPLSKRVPEFHKMFLYS